MLNVNGFFDLLLAFLDRQHAEGFMRREHRDMLIVDTDPLRLLDRCDGYQAPTVSKWIDAAAR
jgi:predicted Rossmann-fold nucleotide-binding protein